MFTYCQSTGVFTNDSGAHVATGYSGNGPARNDPASQHIEGHGPLPQGSYSIGAAEHLDHLGAVVMALTPHLANRMFGRSGFFIHGDNASLNHSASDGCIILNLQARQTIAASPDRDLTVTA